MEDNNKIGVLEGLLFVVGDDGLSLNQIMEILELDKDEAYNLINSLEKKYEDETSGLHIHFLGDTFKLTTKKEHREYYEKLLFNEENNSLSNSALETLAIIAYNEPVTRIQVDEIRGVQSSQLIRKLVAKGLVKEDGRSNLPGRPILYKTTNEFLDYFGLSNISELPKIEQEQVDDSEVDLYKSTYKDDEVIE
jgi:segregation and condensation protein B